MSKDCCKECGRESVLDGKVRCVDPGCSCHGHAENEHKEEWEAEFDELFPAMGISDKESQSIYRHDQYNQPGDSSHLKAWISDLLRRREAKVREEVLQEVEKLFPLDHLILNAEGLMDDTTRAMKFRQVILKEVHDGLARLRSQGTDTTTH